MRKCFNTTDEDGNKVFIPGCMGAIYHDGVDECYCKDFPKYTDFEKREYNQALKELRKDLSDLEKENIYLHQVIKKLKNKVSKFRE